MMMSSSTNDHIDNAVTSVRSQELETTLHVAALAFPYGTHAAPLLSLVMRLAGAAPGVVFSFFTTAASSASLFGGPPAAGSVRVYEVADGLREGFVFRGDPEEPVNMFLGVAEAGFRAAVAAAEADTGRRVTCLIADAFFGFAADMAEEMHAPWIAYWVSGPRSLLVHLNADDICQKMGSDVQEDTMLDFIHGFSTIPAGDILEMVKHNPESAFSTALHNLGHALPRATAVTLNAWEETGLTIELKSKLKDFLSVGPFGIASPKSRVDVHGCLEWLEGQKPRSVAYIAFGSVTSPPPDETRALAEALQELDLPFIWSMKPRDEAKLPKEFLQGGHKGKIVPWAPQEQVLGHPSVGTYVTHGGYYSVMESILGGVPMICRGFFADHKVNARTVNDVWATGLVVAHGRFTKAGTAHALQRILSVEEGMEMRKRVGVIKEIALKAVEPGGISTRNFETLVRLVSK